MSWQLSGFGFCQYYLMTKPAITLLPVDFRHENHGNGCCEKTTFQTSFPNREFFELKRFILHWKYLSGWQTSLRGNLWTFRKISSVRRCDYPRAGISLCPPARPWFNWIAEIGLTKRLAAHRHRLIISNDKWAAEACRCGNSGGYTLPLIV